MRVRIHPWLASLVTVGWIVGGVLAARPQTTTNRPARGEGTNRVERTREPAKPGNAGRDPAQTEREKAGKPLPSFTPREKVSVDQELDFPVDI